MLFVVNVPVSIGMRIVLVVTQARYVHTEVPKPSLSKTSKFAAKNC